MQKGIATPRRIMPLNRAQTRFSSASKPSHFGNHLPKIFCRETRSQATVTEALAKNIRFSTVGSPQTA
jgi:hypothetical protein